MLLKLEEPVWPGDQGGCLGRTRDRTEAGVVTIPNQRIIEDFLKLLVLEKCKPVNSPGLKSWTAAPGDGDPLSAEDHAIFRSSVGKLQFVADDRPEIKNCVKECARDLSSPTGLSMRRSKLCVPYDAFNP